LEEIGFVVLSSTDEPLTLFPRRLLRHWSNTLVGAATVAGHRHRADVVVAVDGAGEVFTRTADSTFDPGAHREHPPRPLSDREAQRVEEIRRQGREGGRG
ncbi:MAG TPA: hypothetical protein VLW53_07670, partial [Candidatus Eisenbacteria bacterium]|nr:hypothetical protein [Candidatus Eisenbacteria bacterium]